jgi:transposase
MESAVSSPKITPKHAHQSADRIAHLEQNLSQRDQQIQILEQQLDWFKRQLFGSKSEKRLHAPAEQMDIADLLSMPAVESAPAEEKVRVSYLRGKRKQRDEDCATDKGLRFDGRVPVKTIHINAPELSGPDADQYEVIDYKISYRLGQQPSSYVVLKYSRPVLKKIASQTLITTPAPASVFEGSMADVSVLAGLLVDKFAYHLPLYRQHQRLQAGGITLSRATLTHWCKRTIELLKPIYQAQLDHILLSRVLAMDETPIKAGRKGKNKGKMRQGWLWPIYGEDDEICFTYSSSRGAIHLESVLKGFSGVLLTDGYAAYDKFAKNKPITQAQCWVHARRYFIKAEKAEPEAAAQALDQIGELYKIEKSIRVDELPPDKKRAYREERSTPLVDGFFAWCREQQQRIDLINSNPLSRAIKYAVNHQEQMRVFLADPDVPMDTNHVERNLRGIPLGRKNWMFCWTEVGAHHVGIIQSLITSCRLQGIDPYTYLVDVLQRVSVHPAKRVEELTPRCWKEHFAQAPLKSDLDITDD